LRKPTAEIEIQVLALLFTLTTVYDIMGVSCGYDARAFDCS
jgi:hypothetical protein